MLQRLSWRLAVGCAVALSAGLSTLTAQAEIKLPRIFGSNMVLQQGMQNPVWGWGDAGEKVTVTVDGQSVSATAGDDGAWRVKLPELKVGGPYAITVSGSSSIKLENVLVGEVWLCSGQSNMQWAVDQADDADLEKLTAKFPNIRLITVPQVGTQEPQNDFGGEGWQVCSPETVGPFSAVGYFFGRQLHQTLDVPVGLIDDSWGGSACEAWVRRDLLAADERYAELLARWEETEKTFNYEKATANYREAAKKAREAGKQPPRAPRNILAGQHRPANLYNGVLKPTIGYGIKGAIWYQGESNAGRAYQYRHLFPLMIQSWRDEWGQGDFPFYFVQLADFQAESPEPQDSTWAELREAQTMTIAALPNTGQAVITDLGEASDIHPKDKQNVAKRLTRWALARDYGHQGLIYRSPQYKSHEVDGNKIVVEFDTFGSALDTFDVRDLIGFTIAGEDQKFVNARAQMLPGGNKIAVWADGVDRPASARYAWAQNPICNVQNREGLPLTPFRTDDWKGITADVHK